MYVYERHCEKTGTYNAPSNRSFNLARRGIGCEDPAIFEHCLDVALFIVNKRGESAIFRPCTGISRSDGRDGEKLGEINDFSLYLLMSACLGTCIEVGHGLSSWGHR